MATTNTAPHKQERKEQKRKQEYRQSNNFGSPQVPLRKIKTKQVQELLSDWEDAS